ncbi:Glycosyl transferase family 11 [Lutibacter oricola]|uniref:Glycosyl transferase family 11 n=1 Tax=Lutibacter oricola TaxID=762486 RepID=A0A1H3FQ60_9FLAO|nr:alpha-1,2-fucosyltransferase [Lutibacter oricola]SDX93060.1 Glycosyl transferase family 11 [Lutibacter oricola]
MIVVRVIGGVGNQLFQYLFGQYLESKYKQPVFYDVIAFETVNKERSLELQLLFPNMRIYNGNRFKFSRNFKLKAKLSVFLFKLNKKNHYITDDSFNKLDDIKPNDIYYFNGYWQNKDVFSKRKLILGNNLKLKEIVPLQLKDIVREIKKSNSVSVHVRRGDYFVPKNIKTYGVCTKGYYQKAFFEIKKNYPKNLKYFVFTDDIDWVKNNLSLPCNSIIVNNFKINSYWYIYLMSLCKSNIISNSSFSWWAAYLNMNSSKTVIVPKKWTLTSEKSLALDHWIKL